MIHLYKSAVGVALVLPVFAFAAGPIEIQGHRGARALRSENTLQAMEYALDLGVDTLELDIAVTKDKQLVLSHDPHVNPALCLDPDGKVIPKDGAPWIHELTLAELRRYDCGSIKHEGYPRQIAVSDRVRGRITPMPTLDEVFELVKKREAGRKGKKVQFNIETKSFRDIHRNDVPVAPTEFATLWLDKVKEHGMLSRSTLQSFDYRTLVAAKGLEKKVRLVALTEDPKENLLQTARQLGVEVMSPRWNMPNLNSQSVRELQAQGFRVIPWTANTAEAWDKLIELRVDGIISDDPAGLIEHLRARDQGTGQSRDRTISPKVNDTRGGGSHPETPVIDPAPPRASGKHPAR